MHFFAKVTKETLRCQVFYLYVSKKFHSAINCNFMAWVYSMPVKYAFLLQIFALTNSFWTVRDTFGKVQLEITRFSVAEYSWSTGHTLKLSDVKILYCQRSTFELHFLEESSISINSIFPVNSNYFFSILLEIFLLKDYFSHVFNINF